MSRSSLVYTFSLFSQALEGCLDELDNQADAIDDHLIKIASRTPAKDEEVYKTHTHTHIPNNHINYNNATLIMVVIM